MRSEPFRDRDHLLGRLPLPEDDLGVPLAQRAMLVDARESEIVDRRVVQLSERRVDREATGRYVRQQRPNAIAPHAASVSCIQPLAR